MTGNNQIELNQATMKEAVQMWLDSRLTQSGAFGTFESVKSVVTG